MPYVRYGYHQTLKGRAHRLVRRAGRALGRPGLVMLAVAAILIVAGGLFASPLRSTFAKPPAKPAPPQLYLLTDAAPEPAAKPGPPVRRPAPPPRRAEASRRAGVAPAPPASAPDYTGDLNAGVLAGGGGGPTAESAAGAAPAAESPEKPAEGSGVVGGAAPQ